MLETSPSTHPSGTSGHDGSNSKTGAPGGARCGTSPACCTETARTPDGLRSSPRPIAQRRKGMAGVLFIRLLGFIGGVSEGWADRGLERSLWMSESQRRQSALRRPHPRAGQSPRISPGRFGRRAPPPAGLGSRAPRSDARESPGSASCGPGSHGRAPP